MTILYIFAGLVLAGILVANVSESWRRGWSVSVWIGLLAVLTPNMTNLVATFTGGRQITYDSSYERVVVIGGLAARVNEYATPLLAVFLGFVVVTRLGQLAINSVALAYLGIALVANFAVVYMGGALMSGQRLAALVAVSACVLIAPSREVLVGAALGGLTLAVASLVSAAAVPAVAIDACSANKCGVFGEMLVGVADNTNALGILMALAVPVVWFGLARFARVGAALVTFVALATGSRTSQIAALVTLALLLLASASLTRRLGRGALVFLSAAALIAGAVAPFVGLSASSLTGRPALWIVARDGIQQSPVIGNGTVVWRGLVDAGVIPRAAGYSVHNQFLEVLYVSGLVGGLLFVILIVSLYWRHRRYMWMVSALILPAAIVGITERPWPIAVLDWLFWSVIVLLLADFESSVPETSSQESRASKVRVRRPVISSAARRR